MPFESARPPFHVAEGRYTLKLVDFEDYIMSGDYTQDGQDKPMIRWIFNVQDPKTGEWMRDSSGEVAHIVDSTSTATGPRSRARPMLEALAGRTFSRQDDIAAIAATLPGTVMDGYVEINERGYNRVLKLIPNK